MLSPNLFHRAKTRLVLGVLVVLLAEHGSCSSSSSSMSSHTHMDFTDVGMVISCTDQQHHRSKRRVEPKAFDMPENGMDDEPDEEMSHTKKKKYHRLEHSIKISTKIRSRYALTLVRNEVLNTEDVAREVFFTVILPDTAFISKFGIEVDDEVYLAEVMEKEKAWKQYKEAVDTGKTAGHVGISARHSNKFKVSVNTRPQGVVRFYLLYEELLKRKSGTYTYLVNISPHQKLSDYSIEVDIMEQSNITRLTVPALKSHFIKKQTKENSPDELKDAHITMSPSAGGSARVVYTPDVHHLQDKAREAPLQFVVEYAVEKQKPGGQLQLYEGYFVHFVAPEDLKPMPKHVVLVLDTSGSMRQRKMQQTVNAIITILGQMQEHDFITILRFSNDVTVWELDSNSIVPTSKTNIQLAIEFVRSLEAKGETNINSALVKALTITTHVQQKGVMDGVPSIILFLTDGFPTKGVRDPQKILDNVREANKNADTAIFSLAFGAKTDFSMLKKLSIQNSGFARKIYAASDASLQLEGFYKEISSPMLSNVHFDYLDSALLTQSVTETVFHTFYEGGEMVVAGAVDPSISQPFIEYQITALQSEGEFLEAGQHDVQQISEFVDNYIEFLPDVRLEYNFLERLWAYLTVQGLFHKLSKGELVSCEQPEPETLSDVLGDPEELPGADQIICNNLYRALYLSLRYQFVTPLTSLVVVKPDDSRETGDLQQADRYRGQQAMKAVHQITFNTASTPTRTPSFTNNCNLILFVIVSVYFSVIYSL